MMSPLMAAAKRFRHLRFWFAAALIVVDTVSLSAASVAATSSIPLQVTVLVQNTCSMAVTPPVSAPPAVPRNAVRVDCQYAQAYTVDVEPAVSAETAANKSAPPVSGNPLIITVTY
ncbi:MAG: hypothetical protein KGO48_16305 [Alphaproteobacteria bacterium]|nr:hypothetical protein [Alphaproteobacteria bacterium]